MKKAAAKNSNQTNKKELLPIVGIGASAGGLKALKEFFSRVPEDSGLAFVVVVHLSPEHKSLLAELLQPHVKMPVTQVSKNQKLEPNHVYVIPPNSNLNTIDTHLRLSDMEEKRSERAPIDHFFRTLAKTHDGSAIGIILTGTGSDGTLGMKEIKEKGGLTIVQDPLEAEYDGMPQSAIATGLMDLVLPLDEITDYLIRFIKTEPRIKLPEDEQELDEEEAKLVKRVFSQVRARTGRDFTRYKLSTLMRRMKRRMQIYEMELLSDYLELLRKNPEEVRALSDDFLINVTNFFRDKQVFEYLEQTVVPKLFENRNNDSQVRIWSVGCATGEEAYSLAMMLYEVASEMESPPAIQIFASDLHENSLKKAREGYFPGDINLDITTERLKRFFTRQEGGFRIRKEIREMVIFTPHNLLSDPPFSRVDLIMCRNLLIYLKKKTQQNIFELLHYSLVPGGYLVLGASESLSQTDLFKVKNNDFSVFTRKNVTSPEPKLPVFPTTKNHFPEAVERTNEELVSMGALHHKAVERFAPPSILISPEYQLLHVSETAGRYLSMPGGEPSRDAFKLIRKELALELRSILHTAKEKKTAIRSKPIIFNAEGEKRQVFLSVRIIEENEQENAILVLFEEYDLSERPAEKIAETPKDATLAKVNDELQDELQDKDQQLQAIIEEYETSREEMKASNEELQSSNEELRSTLEELETSKEELQSLNEELTTLNQENRHKVAELSQVHDDLQNLLSATDIATLFINKEMRIQRYTTKLGELFNIRPQDRGRLISDITNKLGYENLKEDAEKVIRNLQPIEKETTDEKGNIYLTRLRPYRSSEDKIDGVVITFIDITKQKEVEKTLEKQKTYAESIIETLHEPLLVLNPDLTVRTVNESFYNHFEVNKKETVGRKIYNLGNGQWNIPELHQLLEDVLPDDKVFKDFEVEHDFETIGKKTMLLNARRLDHVQLILLGIRDITERKQHEMVMQRMLNVEQVGMLRFSDDAELLHANDSFLKMIGYTREEYEKEKPGWEEFTPEEYVGISKQQLKKLEKTGKIGPYEKEYFMKDGARKWMMFAGSSLGDGTFVEYCFDISDKKKAEKALEENEERLRLTLDAMDIGSWMREHDSEFLFIDENNARIFGFNGRPQTISTDKIYERMHPEDRERIQQAAKKAWEKDSGYIEEFRVRVNGEERWLVGRGKVVQDGSRKMIGINYDITERKNAQQELQQAKVAAEKAAKIKEEFLAHMSHEIRTPLNSIIGFSHILLEQTHNEQQKKNLTHLNTAAENLQELINDILDYSKLRSGKWKLKPENVTIRDSIEDIISTHLPAATDKNINLETVLDDKIPEQVMTDETKLQHVLNNLISNAIKFTEKGKVKVDVKLNRRKNKKLWLEFSVSDTGIGIKKKQLEHIFDEFRQADQSKKKQYKGTGLGLSIVKMYLKILGSEINVESKPGEGSRFWFVLPVKEAAKTPEKEQTPEQEKQAQVNMEDARILIVEDDSFSRLMMSQMLQMWGIKHDQAEDGKEGIELAEKNNYDIIYMDVHMPVMDGIEATQILRKMKKYKNKPILALTANVTDSVTELVKSGLFSGKTIKPFDPDTLLDEIKKILDDKKVE